VPASALMTHFLHRLSEGERRAIEDASSPSQRFPANRTILQANAPSSGVYLIRAGFACRYVTLRAGERQILSFIVPGDLCDVRLCFADTLDFSIATLTPVEATPIPRDTLITRGSSRPEVARELNRLLAIEDATTRQWLLNVGHRSAFERLAHLLCECFARLSAVGLGTRSSCVLSITQRDIADALALSPVHVNRTLMELRRLGLVEFSSRQLMIPDLHALQEAAWFDPLYLQLENSPFAESIPLKRFEREPLLRSAVGQSAPGSLAL
jgi:CRP-like cAMP-binding protein